MKETKRFFDNNRLNKGYRNIPNYNKSDKGQIRSQFSHVLPPIDMIEQYEELYPGTLETLIDMAKNEQQHRHAVSINLQQKYDKARNMGRIFSLILIGLICFTTLILGFSGNIILGSVFAMSAFACIAYISYIYSKLEDSKSGEEQMKTRRPYRR